MERERYLKLIEARNDAWYKVGQALVANGLEKEHSPLMNALAAFVAAEMDLRFDELLVARGINPPAAS